MSYIIITGVRTQREQSLWQLGNFPELEAASAGPIISTARTRSVIPSAAKSEYRDGAPHRRKSVSFPVLEHCGIPEDCLALGQRQVPCNYIVTVFRSVFLIL